MHRGESQLLSDLRKKSRSTLVMSKRRRSTPTFVYPKPQKRYRRGFGGRFATGPAGQLITRDTQIVIPATQDVAMNPRSGGYLGIEKKFLDCAWNAVTINVSSDGTNGELQPSSGCTGSLSVPAQGDGESERDGRQYCITSCYVSGIINTTADSDVADPIEGLGYFFALVLDTQANGATVDSENVYINPSTNTNAMLPQPLRNLQYSKRFKILDRVYVPNGGLVSMTDGTNTGSLNVQNAPHFTLSWRGKILCNCGSGTTADIANATDNALHLLGFAGSSTYTPTFVGKSRIRFVG